MRRAPMRATSTSPACMSRRFSSRRLECDTRAQSPVAFAARRAQRDIVFRGEAGRGRRLVGYEDSRARFLGEGSLAKPTGCEPARAKLDDEGKLWTFDPAASFTPRNRTRRRRRRRAEFIIGRADNAAWAAELSRDGWACRPSPNADLQRDCTRRAPSNRHLRSPSAGLSPSRPTARSCV